MADGPRQKQKRKNGSSNNITYGQFIRHTFTEADKEWLRAADLETEFPISLLADLVSEGYKVSFSWDDKNQTCICSCTDKTPQSSFAGFTLTGRGTTVFDCWYALAYRHFHLASGDWSAFQNSSGPDSERFG